MAMMMTGRVLLVCALCVLWCGACGVYARDRDSNELVGSMSSGVLGANLPHMPSGSDKNAVMLPTRSVLPITVAEALNENDVSVTTEEDADLSLNTGSLHAAANGGTGGIGNTIDSHAGGSKTSGGEIGSPGAGAVGVQGEGAQRSGGGGDPNGSGHSTLETLGREASGKGGDQSGVRTEENSRNPPAELSPSVHSKPPLTPPEPAGVPQIQNAPQVLPQKTPQTAEASPSPVVSAEDRGTPESRDSQISSEETKKHSTSETKTESQVKEKFSNGGLTEEDGQEATTPNLAKNAVTETPTKTTASSLSTSGTGDVQTTTDTVDNGAQRPNTKEPQDGFEDGNTKVPPRASGAAPQTAKTATITQKNDTATSTQNSDGSTAVSHTTSPLLLLLVVACASAAAVVAA
ncbi:Mucin-associated surface protein (MASP) [Trypanosoma cruzi]|uniref:Mucin-associated surface protein (MASP), putative n=2 Tax=Trypanosoma cruzi TaxID=5693 RepID=Q4DMA1_TRYCC|nr:mucin-associated surface protein (MASP), putative [Trypanosoma cruzi]EAN93645.1 mucin-associated surface protein (MASP), putative [Trypanosoma cruzi]PWU93176.1 Mucin-associated surface protein (MASP) [Trypanosoma cruzi]RNC33200.1 mucin-associated surface protein (MASP) [Trypanosoma cruzi]|eukprot:XP_815496.1 mucin-associated surface protein (MASP) [Trypanosoma cruzi strain CL Brener]